MNAVTPTINWENQYDRHFCSTVGLLHRSCIDIERFYELLDLAERDPELLAPGEMGMYNILVLEGNLRVDNRSGFHQFVQMDTRDSLVRRFVFDRANGPIAGILMHVHPILRESLKL